jgi:hypothetical protein
MGNGILRSGYRQLTSYPEPDPAEMRLRRRKVHRRIRGASVGALIGSKSVTRWGSAIEWVFDLRRPGG